MATAKQVAEHLFMSDRNVRKLIQTNVLRYFNANELHIDDCRERYIRHLRDVAAGRKADDNDGPDLTTERALLAREQRIGQEMKNAQLRGELVPVTVATTAVESAFTRVRARLLGLPAKAAPVVITLGSAAAAQAWLDEQIAEALEELARTEVEAPADDGTDMDGAGSENSEGGEELVDDPSPAAEAQRGRVGRRVSRAKPRGKRGAGKVADR